MKIHIYIHTDIFFISMKRIVCNWADLSTIISLSLHVFSTDYYMYILKKILANIDKDLPGSEKVRNKRLTDNPNTLPLLVHKVLLSPFLLLVVHCLYKFKVRPLMLFCVFDFSYFSDVLIPEFLYVELHDSSINFPQQQQII